MEIYHTRTTQSGEPLSVRANHFETCVDALFERWYPHGAQPPADLIHVSCTGYVSPSGAQKIVSRRGWGRQTTVTHAYHMGCYAAVPALRMARGFLRENSQVDIAHTELCSLHVNLADHRPGTLVAQTLFADGFIKYTASTHSPTTPHLQVVALREEILEDSLAEMSWKMAEWGFEMTLSREIPFRIKQGLRPFLDALAAQAGYSGRALCDNALFAVHPGGPRILDQIKRELQLKEEQMTDSIELFRRYGNMSSATLPHIWERMLSHPSDAPIVSLAFGPGLSIAGALLEQRSGSCGG
jgi:predicted naringenin-chalcone synthase